jgi:hypothetical protein
MLTTVVLHMPTSIGPPDEVGLDYTFRLAEHAWGDMGTAELCEQSVNIE